MSARLISAATGPAPNRSPHERRVGGMEPQTPLRSRRCLQLFLRTTAGTQHVERSLSRLPRWSERFICHPWSIERRLQPMAWTLLAWQKPPASLGAGARRRTGCLCASAASTLTLFVGMNNTGTRVDLWAIDGLDEGQLVESENGFLYVPGGIAVEMITLVEMNLDSPDDALNEVPGDASSAYQSSLVIELDAGTVLRGDAAQRFVEELRIARAAPEPRRTRAPRGMSVFEEASRRGSRFVALGGR